MMENRPFAWMIGLGVFALWSTPCAEAADPRFSWDEDSDPGALVLRESGRPVFAYVYANRGKEGVDPKYERACYVHPLYDLDGRALTEDFPTDHFHHRGMWWSWPRMKVRGQAVQTWHPSPLRQRFVEWLRRDLTAEAAVLSARNEWVMDDSRVGLETVTLTVRPAAADRRVIELSLSLEAVNGPIELLGAETKGYGGLTLRFAPPFTGGALTTNQGRLGADSTLTPYLWADLSTGGRGVTVQVEPDHPDAPIGWLLRNSYAGVVNAAWPGLTPVTLQPGQPITLNYRLIVHRTLRGSRPDAQEP